MDIVALSGGYDSSLLAYKMVAEGKDILCVYCSFGNNVNLDKKRMEMESIFRLRKKCERDFGKGFDLKEFGISYAPFSVCGIPMQATIAIEVSLCAPSNESTIYFGYHRGDDIFHYKESIETIRKGLSETLNKKIVFEYPFEWAYKSQILATVKKCGLSPWTCEGNPVVKKNPCGKCLPCQNLLLAEKAIRQGGIFSEAIDVWHWAKK
jgi:7-cyano-7-deazaguanine synthase in queuosine biosynthesis